MCAVLSALLRLPQRTHCPLRQPESIRGYSCLKTVARRPFSGWATQARCACIELVLENVSEMGPHLARER